MTSTPEAELEEMAATPAASGQYRIQRRLKAHRPTWRIWAESSPFGLKNVFKARGYKWNPDGTPFPNAWFIGVSYADREAELVFRQQEIYRRDIQLLTRKIDAFSRFSDRIWQLKYLQPGYSAPSSNQ